MQKIQFGIPILGSVSLASISRCDELDYSKGTLDVFVDFILHTYLSSVRFGEIICRP